MEIHNVFGIVVSVGINGISRINRIGLGHPIDRLDLNTSYLSH